MHARNKDGDQLAITVHSINDVQLTRIGQKLDRFSYGNIVSEQSRTVKNSDGVVLEHESEEKAIITDIWVFERDTQLNDPELEVGRNTKRGRQPTRRIKSLIWNWVPVDEKA